jgi:hypothetical protein
MTKSSYTAADQFPVKMLKNRDVMGDIRRLGRIPPHHVQFIPTNRCNLACTFCSCAAEDRSVEMTIADARRYILSLVQAGMKAVTITGGGEPLMHPDIVSILAEFHSYGIEIGLVTNGLLLHTIDPEALRLLTWCRISHDDGRMFDPPYRVRLAAVRERVPIDWSFSYVVSKNPLISRIQRVINFADGLAFTHVRLVADLTDPDAVPMDAVASDIYNIGNVIIQRRNDPDTGRGCYVAYLRPVIAADGSVYRCCGAQYALGNEVRGMPPELRMGHMDAFSDAMSLRTVNDGFQCACCYYGAYNRMLESLLQPIEHGNFV